MNRNYGQIGIVFAFIMIIIFSVPTKAPAPPINGWMSTFSNHIGLKPSNGPILNGADTNITGEVIDPMLPRKAAS